MITLSEPGSSQDNSQPPIISDDPPIIQDPYPTGTINTTTPTISASFSDDKGINLDAISLHLNGVDVTQFSTISPNTISYTTSELDNATINQVDLRIVDTSGAEATLSWEFMVLIPRTPEFIIKEVAVSPSIIQLGDQVEVSLLILNIGKSGNQTIATFLDGP